MSILEGAPPIVVTFLFVFSFLITTLIVLGGILIMVKTVNKQPTKEKKDC